MNAAAWLLLVVALVLLARTIQHFRGRHGSGCRCRSCGQQVKAETRAREYGEWRR
jgi:hypothetical protein